MLRNTVTVKGTERDRDRVQTTAVEPLPDHRTAVVSCVAPFEVAVLGSPFFYMVSVYPLCVDSWNHVAASNLTAFGNSSE